MGSWNGLVATNTLIAHDIIHQCGARPANNHEHCVYDSGNHDTVEYNLIYDCADRAVQLYPGPQYPTVDHNIIDDSSQGVDFSGDPTKSTATNNATVSANIITNAGLDTCDIAGNCYGLGSYWGGGTPGAGNVAASNCLFNNLNGDITGTGYTSTGNVVANPGYADEPNRNYNITTSSPCYALTGNIAGDGQGP